ncbi:hypothetical protein K3495_g174 [Podosphaera aphanis]|nr:hypothetical protein K3495_g174 [Podosphaera aphanis]
MYSRCRYVTLPFNDAPTQSSPRPTDADVCNARSYCSNLIKKFDSPTFTLQTFIPITARDAYLAIYAFNIEIAMIADSVSSESIASMRTQVWRDIIRDTFKMKPRKEPISILLDHALYMLRSQHATTNLKAMEAWFLKIITAREKYVDNRQFTFLSALETYAENTYSSLMYLTLAALPVNSMDVDHIASHIGKATGIAAVLRGVPLIAFPPPEKYLRGSKVALGFDNKRNANLGAVTLPIEIMKQFSCKEEDIFRRGPDAEGLKDVIFTIATRANDHVNTAKEILKNLRQGKDIDHIYEHAGEEEHQYASSTSKLASPVDEIEKSFGVFMPAVATSLWLNKLEKYDFDIFRPEMRAREWRLPWKSFWAYTRRSF